MCSRLLIEILDKENNMDFAEVERHRADRILFVKQDWMMKFMGSVKTTFLETGNMSWMSFCAFFSYIIKTINIFQGKNSSH